MLLAAKVRLNGYCSAGDECLDVNAVCRNGVCICQPNYYDNGRDSCCECTTNAPVLIFTVVSIVTPGFQRYVSVRPFK